MPESTTVIPAQKDGGATIVEIAQQPDAWRELPRLIDGRARDFLSGVLERDDLRVILTGAGSSAFAGQIVAPALRRHLGRRVEAIPTTSIVANPADLLERRTPTLLVSFGRSGNSPESVAATRIADELVDEVWHLILSCDANGQLAQTHSRRDDSLVVLMPERTNDTGFAMTSSLTSMMLTCLLLLGPADRSSVHALADAAQRLIDDRAGIRALADAHRERFVYLGSGALEGLARESALKLLELTAGEVVTYFDSPLGFRHGPKSVLDPETLVVVYMSADAYTRRYDEDIIAEIRAQLDDDNVVALAPGDQPSGNIRAITGLDGLDDSQLAVVYLVFAQYLALFTALGRDKTPDNPFPGGEVSRVVKGVTIHPLTPDHRAR
ncbi:SIS domain-containing protein [Mycolicibacterium sp. S2-37]|uniref:SIS domain-containing protein n=1 Tax=Mycolicibacterium sp. S2-37 TaxID=2810297 RepID=UPI001A94AC94|nr:SIS domain-containing protein [Mycolicibacterium sp. S2-37]MBO0681075.1 SIS domain-containing protein [Mycolicibacterium sp. S2-37]